jgi:Acetyltransferase (GNAT) domain
VRLSRVLANTRASASARIVSRKVATGGPGVPGVSGASEFAVERHDGILALQQLATELDQVNQASTEPSPFASSAFTIAYASNSERDPLGMDVRLFVVRDVTGKVLGWAVFAFRVEELLSLPEAITHRWTALEKLNRGAALLGRAPRLELMTTSDVDRPGIVARAGHEELVAKALLNHLIEHERDWTLLEWRAQERDSALWSAAHSMKNPFLRVRDVELDPYSEVALQWPDVGAYFRALSKRMRSNVSRQARKLFASGDVTVVMVNGPEATAAFFDAYTDLETRSWKYQSSAAIGRHPLRMKLYSRIVSGQAGIEPSLIGIALDGVLIAALINGRFEGRMWSMEMAFDESWNEVGPGQLLLLLAVMDGIEKQCRSLNFFQLHGYFKRRWLAEELPVVNVQLIRRPSLHDIRGLGGDAVRRTKTRMSSFQKNASGSNRVEPGDSEHSGPPTVQSQGPGGESNGGPASSSGGFNALKRGVSLSKVAEVAEVTKVAIAPQRAQTDRLPVHTELIELTKVGEPSEPTNAPLGSKYLSDGNRDPERRLLFALAVQRAQGSNGVNAGNVRILDATGASSMLPFPVL